MKINVIKRRSLVIIILFLSILLYSCKKHEQKKNVNTETSTRNYDEIISNAINIYLSKKTITDDQLENAVPLSEDEFLTYYRHSYPDNGKLINQTFIRLDSDIVEKAKKNDGKFLKLYLEMSPFVDGEYAESYFEDIDFIIDKNSKLFCQLYETLNTEVQTKLKDYQAQYCK